MPFVSRRLCANLSAGKAGVCFSEFVFFAQNTNEDFVLSMRNQNLSNKEGALRTGTVLLPLLTPAGGELKL